MSEATDRLRRQEKKLASRREEVSFIGASLPVGHLLPLNRPLAEGLPLDARVLGRVRPAETAFWPKFRKDPVFSTVMLGGVPDPPVSLCLARVWVSH